MDKNKFIKTAKSIGVGSLIAAMIVMNGCVKEYSLPIGKDGEETVVMTSEKGPMREWLSHKKVHGLAVMKEENLKKLMENEIISYGFEMQALPLKFMEEEGLLKKYNVKGDEILRLPYNIDSSATAFAYADTTNNTITTIAKITNESGYLETYKLTYNVTEDDIKTFKYLDGDPRLNFFIQGLDEVYEREVELKAITNSSLDAKFARISGATINPAKYYNSYYFDNINIEDGTIQFIYQTEDGLRRLDAQITKPINPDTDCITIDGTVGLLYKFANFLQEPKDIKFAEDRPVVISKENGYYIPDYSQSVISQETYNFKENFNEKIFK